MKKIILIVAISLLLTGCGLVKTDETKTTGAPTSSAVTNQDSLEKIGSEAEKTEIEDFNEDLNSIDQDINQL